MKRTKDLRFENEVAGITLISLVITIVILIILATVSINAVVGENGIIRKAQQVKNIYEESINEELSDMEKLVLNFESNLYVGEYKLYIIYTNEDKAYKWNNEVFYDITDLGYTYYGETYTHIYGLITKEKVTRENLEIVNANTITIKKISYDNPYDIDGDGDITYIDAMTIMENISKIMNGEEFDNFDLFKIDINRDKKATQDDEKIIMDYL